MTKRMLIDTTHAEETRVVVLDGNRLDDYDVETSAKKQLKGNIYLAKIVRIEPSLQAAFVEYGGNRHGFLAFAEIHPDYYQIPVADRERLIALQEEEARAEEVLADRDDDEREAAGGPGNGNDDTGGDEDGRSDDRDDERPDDARDIDGHDDDVVETTAQALPDAPDAGEQEYQAAAEVPPDHAAAERPLAIPPEVVHGDVQDGVEADGQEDFRTDAPAEPDGPVPETVGGESVDDGHAQRRTARFLRQYKIQEVMRRRQILLIQVVKEERGNKGAALTTYISLAGRFCVLMPNSLRGGGVSRKITSAADRRRLKEITSELEIPRGMAMIVRTAFQRAIGLGDRLGLVQAGLGEHIQRQHATALAGQHRHVAQRAGHAIRGAQRAKPGWRRTAQHGASGLRQGAGGPAACGPGKPPWWPAVHRLGLAHADHRPEHAHAADRDRHRQPRGQAAGRDVCGGHVCRAARTRPAGDFRRCDRHPRRPSDGRGYQQRQNRTCPGNHRPRLRAGGRDRRRAEGWRADRQQLYR